MSDIDGLKNYERKWLHRRVVFIDEHVHAGRVGRVSSIARRRTNWEMGFSSRMIDYVCVVLESGRLVHATTNDIELYSGVCD